MHLWKKSGWKRLELLETLPGAGPAWGIDAIVELLREVEEELIREILVQRDVYRRERIVANSISSV